MMFTFGNSAVLHEYLSGLHDDPKMRKDVHGRTIYLSRTQFGALRSPFPRPKIADFGSAAWGDTGVPYRGMCQSDYARAPEVELGAEWSYSIDIWALGVVLRECLEGTTLFQSLGAESADEMARMRLAQSIAFLGPPPKELLERGSRSRKFFNEDGKQPGVACRL